MKIISGGQTGVDRAALDVAIERGMDWGGWCPKGGWAEDFPEPPGLLAKYSHLRETPERHPLQRTEWNVRDSDATLIITDGGGCRFPSAHVAPIDGPTSMASRSWSSTQATGKRPRTLWSGFVRSASVSGRT